jgi:hypothetical protein
MWCSLSAEVLSSAPLRGSRQDSPARTFYTQAPNSVPHPRAGRHRVFAGGSGGERSRFETLKRRKNLPRPTGHRATITPQAPRGPQASAGHQAIRVSVRGVREPVAGRRGGRGASRASEPVPLAPECSATRRRRNAVPRSVTVTFARVATRRGRARGTWAPSGPAPARTFSVERRRCTAVRHGYGVACSPAPTCPAWGVMVGRWPEGRGDRGGAVGPTGLGGWRRVRGWWVGVLRMPRRVVANRDSLSLRDRRVPPFLAFLWS